MVPAEGVQRVDRSLGTVGTVCWEGEGELAGLETIGCGWLLVLEHPMLYINADITIGRAGLEVHARATLVSVDY